MIVPKQSVCITDFAPAFHRIGYSIPMFAGFIIMFFSTLSKRITHNGRTVDVKRFITCVIY